MQKRSKRKLLWPLFWSNTCCSHFTPPCHPEPRINSSRHPEPRAESRGEGSLLEIIKQAQKRLKEELGFSSQLKFLEKFYYHACFKDAGCEKEITYVFVGKYNGEVYPNKNEVADYKWIDFNELEEDLEKEPKIYTPWLRLIVKEIGKK